MFLPKRIHVTQQLAEVTQQGKSTLRQRLREWTWEKEAKADKKRQEVEVSACFLALLRWVQGG